MDIVKGLYPNVWADEFPSSSFISIAKGKYYKRDFRLKPSFLRGTFLSTFSRGLYLYFSFICLLRIFIIPIRRQVRIPG